MELSLQWFGYGAGLVMLGWFAGMVVSVIHSAISGTR